MSEVWLLGLFLLLIMMVSAALLFPLRRNKMICGLLFPVIVAGSIGGYLYWGSFFSWQDFEYKQRQERASKEILKSFKSPQEIIEKLKSKLETNPTSAKGWYLLGKLYLHQQDSKNAMKAFAKAYQLEPEDEKIAIHYAYRLWENNQQVFNEEIHAIFVKLLEKNPQQPDALAMLAMEAYARQDYLKAIEFWNNLLMLAPEQSEEAKAIRQAIAMAEEMMKNNS